MDEAVAAEIVDHIVEILAGESSLTLDQVEPHAGTPYGEILAGLVHLNEDLRYREQRRDEAVRELEAATARLQSQNEELRASQERMESLVRDLSSVIIRLPNDVTMVPLIGALDERRADLISDRLLNHVVAEGSRRVILELSGVSSLDARGIDTLLRITQAVRLLGAEAILVGLQPNVARAVLALESDVSKLVVARSVEGALADQEGRPRPER